MQLEELWTLTLQNCSGITKLVTVGDKLLLAIDDNHCLRVIDISEESPKQINLIEDEWSQVNIHPASDECVLLSVTYRDPVGLSGVAKLTSEQLREPTIRINWLDSNSNSLLQWTLLPNDRLVGFDNTSFSASLWEFKQDHTLQLLLDAESPCTYQQCLPVGEDFVVCVVATPCQRCSPPSLVHVYCAKTLSLLHALPVRSAVQKVVPLHGHMIVVAQENWEISSWDLRTGSQQPEPFRCSAEIQELFPAPHDSIAWITRGWRDLLSIDVL